MSDWQQKVLVTFARPTTIKALGPRGVWRVTFKRSCQGTGQTDRQTDRKLLTLTTFLLTPLLQREALPLGLGEAGFLQGEEEEEGGRHVSPDSFTAAQADTERVTAETDEPRQLGPALTQNAFISNSLQPSVNLLAKVHL